MSAVARDLNYVFGVTRVDVGPQRYLTQLLTTLPVTLIGQLSRWFPINRRGSMRGHQHNSPVSVTLAEALTLIASAPGCGPVWSVSYEQNQRVLQFDFRQVCCKWNEPCSNITTKRFPLPIQFQFVSRMQSSAKFSPSSTAPGPQL